MSTKARPSVAIRDLDRLVGQATGPALSLFRVVVGFLFACHGAASLFGVLGGAYGGGTVDVGVWPDWYAAVIQLVGGTLVALGLVTRTAACLCSGSMAYAYFVVHQGDALFPLQNGGESAAMFCWAFFLVLVAGPGPYALGALVGPRSRSGDADTGDTVTDPHRRPHPNPAEEPAWARGRPGG
jgi:putative oxidoreductase